MDSLPNNRSMLGVVIVAGVLYVAGQYVGSLPERAKSTVEANREITVTGKGIVEIKPDIALVSLGVQTGPQSTADAASRILEEKFTAVLKAVKDLGIEEKDITTTNLSIQPVYDFNDGRQQIRGYEASETIEVKVREIDKAGDVVSKATAQGVNQVGGISFTNDDEGVLQEEAQQKAITDAREKAERLAASLDVRLGRVKSFSASGEPPIFPPTLYATETAGRGGDAQTIPVSPGTQEVSAHVTIVYELK